MTDWNTVTLIALEKIAAAMSPNAKANAVVASKSIGVNDAMKSAKSSAEKRAILKALRDKKRGM